MEEDDDDDDDDSEEEDDDDDVLTAVEVTATGRSLTKRSPPEYVCLCVCVLKCDQVQ
jgi:hypothetical protein